jgi:hypothetical protein
MWKKTKVFSKSSLLLVLRCLAGSCPDVPAKGEGS